MSSYCQNNRLLHIKNNYNSEFDKNKNSCLKLNVKYKCNNVRTMIKDQN